MRHYTAIDKDLLYRLHIDEDLSQRQIAKIVGCSPSKVKETCQTYGIKRKWKYIVKEDYFDEWSEEMAYILGYTMADGCIASKYPSLQYHINMLDVEVLEYIRDNISPDNVIRPGTNNSIYLSIYSLPLCRRLHKLGVTPQKTGKEIVPKMPKKYHKHFIRGVFDGDGTIGRYIVNRGRYIKYHFGITSASQSFLEKIRDLCGGIGHIFRERNGVFYWRIQSKPHVVQTGDFIYGDGGFSLSRKKAVYKEIKNEYVNIL